jgi:Arc/MetJ-type ribon-helix-helix transcriptional regulator
MTITIRLPEELEAKLRARIEAQGRRLPEFVREAIAEKLGREAGGPSSAYELGKNAFGKHGSGRDDLSTNRKAILAELLRAGHCR